MDPRIEDEVSVADLFDQFIDATTMKNVLSLHHRIMNYSDLSPCEFSHFYPKLKSAVMNNRTRKNWKAKALFSRLDKKAAHRCYSNTKIPTPIGNKTKTQQHQNTSQNGLNSSLAVYHNNDALHNFNCLVIGSGPAGLRTAIELQLLGASKVVVVEKRGRFSRNNVLHLWPFVIHDLKSLGAKKFYGKFCAGSIDHISIRQLQLILLKICLILGCDFRDSCSYLHLCPATIELGQSNVETTDKESAVRHQTTKCDLDDSELLKSIEFVKVSEQQLDSSSPAPDADLPCKEAKEISHKCEEASLAASDTDHELLMSCSSSNHDNLEQSDENTHEYKKSSFKCYDDIQRGQNIRGSRAHFQSEYKVQEKELHSYEWDFIIGADGRRNTLSKYFPRKEFRGRLAIAITANFINRQTPAESAVPEISGLSFIYNQDMFQALAYDENINLENICYYKDDTHYFVMTAKKKSLLERGVLINDYSTTQDLLSEKNVNRQALLDYARDAALWTTGLKPLDFALNHYGQEDCAMFDFTSMYAAANACKALRTTGGGLTLVSLVGDSLLEPFWPTGSGCARGFLSSLDAAWMCRQWAVHRCPIIEHVEQHSRFSRNSCQTSNKENPTTHNRMALSVMAERESIYRILAQTTSENLQQTYTHWTLNPHSRYPNLNRHLVLPSQIEHLMTCTDIRGSPIYKGKSTTVEKVRRVKSPSHQRKSPKKLKSANASPQSRSKTLNKYSYKSKSRNDIDSYFELEQSYLNLADYLGRNKSHQYLSYRQSVDLDDDMSSPSISGISPSANNLLSLEAKRSRDIDECLRLRRQRNQLSLVKDHLKQQFKGEFSSTGKEGNPIILNELRRFREQRALARSSGIENSNRATLAEAGPLTILNSIRRCASFAERVKRFENRTISIERDPTPVTPKTPIDTVKNLPEFATLQELFQSKGRENADSSKKLKLPIMKLSKEDWNVKCWEKRLAAYKQRNTFGGSTRSLNKALSVDSYTQSDSKTNNNASAPSTKRRPEKQVEVFKDRIREMADKLNSTGEMSKVDLVKSQFQKLESSQMKKVQQSDKTGVGRAQGWVSHVRSELIKSSDWTQQDKSKRAFNPFAPRQQIKKLFQDDNDEENGAAVDKHYDHLCINRPTNKYLQRNAYTSHLARSKIDSATARVINREPATASRAAYLSANSPATRGKSSTPSSAPLLENPSSAGDKDSKVNIFFRQKEDIICFRCNQKVVQAEKISIDGTSLHRSCLTCASCGITLRTNEILHYLRTSKVERSEESDQKERFVCSICNPSIRDDITKETANRVANQSGFSQAELASSKASVAKSLRSREEFLSQQIDYGVLYKNIIDGSSLQKNNSGQNRDNSSSNRKESSPSSREYEETARYTGTESVDAACESVTSPSPIKFTLPLELLRVSSANRASRETANSAGYSLAPSKTIDGSEQVTLVLPPSPPVNDAAESNRQMMDEEELNRILHLDTSTSKHDDDDDDESSISSSTDDNVEDGNLEDEPNEHEEDESDASDAPIKTTMEMSDESSSLGSTSGSDNDDHDDDDDDDPSLGYGDKNDDDGENHDDNQDENYNEEYGDAKSDETNSNSGHFSACDRGDKSDSSRAGVQLEQSAESR